MYGNFLIEKISYEKSDSNLDKYRVFYVKQLETYYLGDIRAYSNGSLCCYLRIDEYNFYIVDSQTSMCNYRLLNKSEKYLVEKHLNKKNFMHDMSNRKLLEKVTNSISII